MGFYDLSARERVELTEGAIAQRRTVLERWSELETPESSPWNERAAIAGRLLSGCTSVADVGCGLMQLRGHLAAGIRYVPVDVVRRSPETVVVDLNQQSLPVLDVDGFAVLGLLEYVFDVPAVLRQLKGTVVVSYNPIELGEDDRRSHAWVNDYGTSSLEAEFLAAGLRIAHRETLGRQQIWQLVR